MLGDKSGKVTGMAYDMARDELPDLFCSRTHRHFNHRFRVSFMISPRVSYHIPSVIATFSWNIATFKTRFWGCFST
jgi:hypothetical protein